MYFSGKFYIDNLSFLGKAPNTFIAVGTKPDITKSTVTLIRYPDRSKLTPLTKFDGTKTIKIPFPKKITKNNIKWLSIWNKDTSMSLGEIKFPGNWQSIETNTKSVLVPGAVPTIQGTQLDINGTHFITLILIDLLFIFHLVDRF